MEKNYIIALVLMTIIIAVWMLFIIPKREMRDENLQEKKVRTKQEDVSDSEKKTDIVKSNSVEDREIDEINEPVDTGNRIIIDTDYYRAEFLEAEAIAKSWKLKKYNRRDNKDELFDLIPSSAQNCIDIKFMEQPLQLKEEKSVWKADKTGLILDEDSETESITFSNQINDDLYISKTFTFYNNSYLVDLEVSFYNKSGSELTALFDKNQSDENGYMLRWGPGMPEDNLPGGQSQRRRGGHNGAKALTINNKVKEELKEEERKTPVKWVAFENQYFVASIIPETTLETEYRRETGGDVKKTGEENIIAETEIASLLVPGFILKPEQRRAHHFRLYIGPKNNNFLKEVTTPVTQEPAKLDKVIDFGIFGFLAVIMLGLLNIFHKITANYGIAIILLTIFSKVIVYPITRKGYKSMKKMQELQPQMKEIQEKYRDDPKKMNRAVMRLYKENNVNPMSGCIPWIPQLPIFWALISTLRNSIELRAATFIPFIASDLSAPADAIFTIPGLSFIPLLGTPAGLPIRILPILNIAGTFLQQRVTGAGAAGGGSQQKFMKFLPLIFVLLFYNWAAGFILYWLCNNIFITVEQYIVNKKSDNDENDKEARSKKKK